ncbi:MAG: hypothetical protein Q7V05_03030 [Methanoregula sp.]|nr:hypothetical protein [Methanoregula sp.]
MKITKQREIKKLVLGLGYSGTGRQAPPVPDEARGLVETCGPERSPKGT